MARFKGSIASIDKQGRMMVQLSRITHSTHPLGGQKLEVRHAPRKGTFYAHQSVTFEIVLRPGSPPYAADVEVDT